MEAFSALLAICAGNSPANSPHKGQWRRTSMFSLIWINGWVNNREAGDLRYYHAQYDVTVMIGFDQEDESDKKITLQPEIWYHEADHCFKRPRSADAHIFWSRPAEGTVVLWMSCCNILSIRFFMMPTLTLNDHLYYYKQQTVKVVSNYVKKSARTEHTYHYDNLTHWP